MNLVRIHNPNTPKELDVLIGANIRRLREKQGLSQSEFARRLNTTQSRLSDLELGKRRLSISALEEMAEILSVKVVEFFI